jgi:hypothetical protein
MLSDGDKRCTCGEGCATYGECMRKKNIYTAWRPKDYDRWREEGERLSGARVDEHEAMKARRRAVGSSG